MDDYGIYPKQFRNLKIPVEKNRCFILMPFERDFDIIYGNIKRTLNDSGYICNRADEISGSKPIMNKILNEILKAHFIIADLTNQNPNVFYELGIAHTFKDVPNIILITQKLEDIPFDIRHINNIIYSATNLKFLTSSIIQNLNDSKYLYGFYEALQQRNIISIIHDNKEEFIDYLQIGLSELTPIATDILNGNKEGYKEEEIEVFFNRLIKIIDNTLKAGNASFLNGILKVLFESIVVCSNNGITDKIVYDLLYRDLLTNYNLNEEELNSCQIDLAITLASYGTKLNVAVNWLVSYLSITKSATINLNRYKVERFLMVSNNVTINNMMIDALFHENCYVREHMADIVGEKKLFEAGDSLLSQLAIEDNYFTVVSIISAIGKLEVNKGTITILKWIEDEIDEILKTKQLFVLKHAHIALSRLDKRYKTNYLLQFDEKYGNYIKDYFIL